MCPSWKVGDAGSYGRRQQRSAAAISTNVPYSADHISTNPKEITHKIRRGIGENRRISLKLYKDMVSLKLDFKVMSDNG